VDHSCLTALTSEYLIQGRDNHNEVFVDNPHLDGAGLYIRDRQGQAVKVDIPKDGLAFQAGSALEVISGGIFRAVPHFVKGSRTPGLARSTLAVFCQPNLKDKVGDVDFATYARNIVEGSH
jgi:isopenicillin N synthase-like dioxygenase